MRRGTKATMAVVVALAAIARPLNARGESSGASRAKLNSDTCADMSCHPSTADTPATSRHVRIACVTCHGEVRYHVQERFAFAQAFRNSAPLERRLPAAVRCEICHLKMRNRPVTFPQVSLEEHIPSDQRKKRCVDCHRPHDPKPLMGHPMPMPYMRRGRDGCLTCHLKIAPLSGEDRVVKAEARAEVVLTKPVARRYGLGFLSEVTNPPLVDADHGHATVECVSCHGAPPSFRELAARVHGIEGETVRCGKCHTGATIVDQQVRQAMKRGAPSDHE